MFWLRWDWYPAILKPAANPLPLRRAVITIRHELIHNAIIDVVASLDVEESVKVQAMVYDLNRPVQNDVLPACGQYLPLRRH